MFGHIPFVRYLIFLLAGIFSAPWVRLPDALPAGYWLLLSLGLTVVSFALFAKKSTLISFTLYGSLFVTGMVSATMQANRLKAGVEAIENTDYTAYQFVVKSLPEKREKSIRYEVALEQLLTPNGARQVQADALLYFPNDWAALPSVGDRMVVKGQLQRPSSSGFDYRLFLERKGIAWIGYVRDQHFVYPFSGQSGARGVREHLLSLSEASDALLRRYIPHDDAYGLVKAMLLGRRDDIRHDLNAAFVSSGTVHILSVSGLHVAIFFSVLHFLLGPLRRKKNGKYLYLVLIATILMGYAVITGLPASVRRATIMCIIWVLAATFSRKQQPVNTLAFAAFLILLLAPSAFYDVGFQLSFMAMLGIFLLTKPVVALVAPPNRLLKHIWSLSVMSVSAQLMTFPLVVYYFNQFPTYFLFANLLAVDLAGLLIPVAFVLLLSGFAGLDLLAVATGHLISFLARAVGAVVEMPASLPFFLVRDLHLDLLQCVLLLLILLCTYAACYRRETRFVYSTALLIVCFSGYSSWSVVRDYRTCFVRPLGAGSSVVYKSAGRLLILENSDRDFAAQWELSQLVARYGSDTTVVTLTKWK